MSETDIDQLLHDADRAQGGIALANMMGDQRAATALTLKAKTLYGRALALDATLSDLAWKETGNRDTDWLRANGFSQIAAVKGHDKP